MILAKLSCSLLPASAALWQENIKTVHKTINRLMALALTLYVAGCRMDSKDNEILPEKKREGVHAAFYNSTGSRISISTTSGKLLLCDSNLNLLLTSREQMDANSSFFSLDDKHIITGGTHRKLNVWNAGSLQREATYDLNFNSWTSIQGFQTLGGCGEQGKVYFYNIKNHDTIRFVLEPEGAFHLYYIKPDTNFVVSSGRSGYEINLITRKVAHRYSGHCDWVYCVMPDAAARRIVTASKDSTVKVFDRKSEKCLATSFKLDGAVYVSCFNKNGNEVVASTSNGSIYFLDTTLTKVRLKIKAFNSHINTIHLSPTGSRIVAGSEGGGAKLFSVQSGSLLYQLAN